MRSYNIDQRRGSLILGRDLVMEQTIEISDTVAPAAEFNKVRDFFDQLAGVQTAPVVFLKQ